MVAKTDKNIFYFKDCALSALATGCKASTLKEFYDRVCVVPLGSLYYHFWGGRLRTFYEMWEYHNDFAMWAYHKLQDRTLAERLAIIDPSDYEDLEELRKTVLDAISLRLEEGDRSAYQVATEPFYFIHSKIIIFDTSHSISHPHELVRLIPSLTVSSIFYHFIDAHRRDPFGVDDFSAWLQGFSKKYDNLVEKLREIDFYFMSLADLQSSLSEIFTSYFLESKDGEVNE